MAASSSRPLTRPGHTARSGRRSGLAVPAVPVVLAAWAASGWAAGCGADPNGTGDGAAGGAGGPGEEQAVEAGAGATYQRAIVFMDTFRDTSMFVPWEFRNSVASDTLHRSLRGWLGRTWSNPETGARDGQWSLFADDDWTSVAGRAPWQIVPRGPARLVMGPGGTLRELYYRQGFRDLSVRLGDVVAEWNGQRRERYRLLAGTAELSGAEVEGLVLDVTLSRSGAGAGPVEWALLAGDDDFRLLLADPEGDGPYRAWAFRDGQEFAWPEVTVSWDETATVERARREVPVLWRFRSRAGGLSGTLASTSSQVRTLDSPGAERPVLAVYEVAGEVSTGGLGVAVRGFLRHYQR